MQASAALAAGRSVSSNTMQAAGASLQQPTADDVGTRDPVQLAGWTVEGVSVAGQVCLCTMCLYPGALCTPCEEMCMPCMPHKHTIRSTVQTALCKTTEGIIALCPSTRICTFHACPLLLLHSGTDTHDCIWCDVGELRSALNAMCCTQETCILLPEVKVAFDIGRCPNRAVSHQHVFVTHGHMDHIGGIPFHAASRCACSHRF